MTPASIKSYLPPDIIVENYHLTWVNRELPGEVVLVFSPFEAKLILAHYDFGRPALHILDTSGFYFQKHTDALLQELVSAVGGIETSRVICVGSSKGGTGALVVGALLSRALPALQVDSFAFSPQTLLWPCNLQLHLPSYHALMATAGHDQALRAGLENYGDIARVLAVARRFRACIIFGELNKRDREAAYLVKESASGRLVELRPLNIFNHVTLLPYVIDCSDRTALEAALLGTAKRNPNEPDIADLKRQETRMREIESYYSLRDAKLNLAELISEKL